MREDLVAGGRSEDDELARAGEQRGEAGALDRQIRAQLGGAEPLRAQAHLADDELDAEPGAGLQQLLEAGDAAGAVAGIERRAVGEPGRRQLRRQRQRRPSPAARPAPAARKARVAARVANSVAGRSSAAAALAIASP